LLQALVTNEGLIAAELVNGAPGSGGGSGTGTGKGHQVPSTSPGVLNPASPVLFQGTVTNKGPITGKVGKGLPGSGSSHGGGSGSGSGKRQHGTIVITREVDAASPLLWSALVTNEVLTTVKIKWRQDKYGAGVWHVLELSNATITDIHGEPILGIKGRGEKLEFAFERVELKTEFS
jgi:hypothetical protein